MFVSEPRSGVESAPQHGRRGRRRSRQIPTGRRALASSFTFVRYLKHFYEGMDHTLDQFLISFP